MRGEYSVSVLIFEKQGGRKIDEVAVNTKEGRELLFDKYRISILM